MQLISSTREVKVPLVCPTPNTTEFPEVIVFEKVPAEKSALVLSSENALPLVQAQNPKGIKTCACKLKEINNPKINKIFNTTLV